MVIGRHFGGEGDRGIPGAFIFVWGALVPKVIQSAPAASVSRQRV